MMVDGKSYKRIFMGDIDGFLMSWIRNMIFY